ncbi:1-phosphofructokinase family hexose kinase [Actinoplanes sp. DH11]|uniref:1-phosphofructokinase family hexose kinase n=1 Tax=Actinoplanes sp. DH11 TaxID=2857011 RepID=UPI001E3FA3FE|nr:hexose kinase [Actinoplanes sp. DH11]
MSPGEVVAVSLNTALDITYTVPHLMPDTSHRVTDVVTRAGGKGVNVARVLGRLGSDAVVLGLIGDDATGSDITAELAQAGVPARFVRVGGRTRRTVSVVAGPQATVLNEPGPHVTAAEWTAFQELFAGVVREARVVVLTGSRPPGVPVSAYADLAGIATAAGAEVLVDTEGPALRRALDTAPAVAKPNAAEAAELIERPVRGHDDAVAAAQRLVDLGARAGVVSCGADGFVAVTAGASYRVRVPHPVTGNPTGAGDALAAVLAHGLARRVPLPDVLARAAAVSAAAVACPWAGGFDPDVASRLLPEVIVRTTERKQDTCTSPPR